MARQTINIGTAANDGTGDPLRTAFDKINDNFVELYGSDDDATNFVLEDTSPQLGGDLDVNGKRITRDKPEVTNCYYAIRDCCTEQPKINTDGIRG